MLEYETGDTINTTIAYVEEIVYKDDKVEEKKLKTVINPSDEYLNKDNVKVRAKKTIKAQIMEINRIGGRLVKPSYLVGLRLIDGDIVTPVFHIRVRNDEEFKQKLLNEIKFYLKTRHLLK